MLKTVILSTNDNPDYKSYLPYVQKAWNKLGWNTLTFYLGKDNLPSNEQNQIVYLENNNQFREATIVQCSRLFGSYFVDSGMIMTSDVDMMPLSNYWKPEYDDITCYGWDLTNYKQFPICYIAANTENWKKLIPEKNIAELLNKYYFSKSQNFNEWWFTDQLIITERLLAMKDKIKTIDRGTANGLAQGRIDRISWNNTKLCDIQKIDAHMPRPFCLYETLDLLNNILKPYNN